MKHEVSLASLALAAMALSGFAQDFTRRADMMGGGGRDAGKCTIEVDVDGSAEISVSGDSGRLNTLSGQPAVWRRFQCSGPIPRNPGDFRFQGIDGRGRVTLARDPRNNRGVAVVRIDDPQGGREGYTFDLEWRGSNGGWAPAPPPPPPGPGGPNFPVSRAIRMCQDGVQEKLFHDGYKYVDFVQTNPDNRPGRNDWITGLVTGKRGPGTTRFSFECSVDFSSGRIRSVDVNRR